MKIPTVIIGRDGIEYVVSGGQLVEKCYHKTITDKSTDKVIHKVCHDCKKTMIFQSKIVKSSNEKSSFEQCIENFRAYHGRDPKGIELSAML